MVSVIVPIYNASQFLENSIESIFPHAEVGEILLIEDGSTDNSLQVCNALKEKDSRIQVFTHDYGKNLGAGKSRNLGIQKSKFSYIAFLDSDDTYFLNRFKESISILDSNPEVSGCYGKVLINYVDQNRQKLMGVPQGLSPDQLFSYLLNGGYFHTNSITIRKSFLDQVGGFNQNCWPHEDVELWTRLAYYGLLVSIKDDQPIAEYKIHGNNLSKMGNLNTKKALWFTVYKNFFFKPISWKNRYYILKQLMKVGFQKA